MTRFDDRLRTVLAQPATDSHDRAVRWRQLVELVARSNTESDQALVAEAIATIREDSSSVDERVRSAAALSVAALAVPVDLVAAFAADRLTVAAPLLASVRLTASDWKRVSASASEEARSFISTMHSDAAAPAPAPEPPPAPTVEPDHVPSISEVVARIERLRQQREPEPAAPPPVAAEPQEAPRLFKWECNESGEIDWVEGAPRGALIGHSIAHRSLGIGVDASVERAFAERAPFHGGDLELPADGTAGGLWKISGVPAFDRSSGRFAGYRGLAQRSGGRKADALAPDPAGLRELAHEIKTPLNAIIGFAEIISGEYLGPAEGRYRERADEIVAQARLLLTAIEDLDFAAKLRARDQSLESELSDSLAASWEAIERAANERGVTVTVVGGENPARCRLDPQLAQRLVERLCTAAIDSAAAGDSLTFRIGSDGQCCAVSVNLPAALAGLDLTPDRNRRASDCATLPLRLVAGLARTAGGELVAQDGSLVLRLPKA
jgi:hypothetical protein